MTDLREINEMIDDNNNPKKKTVKPRKPKAEPVLVNLCGRQYQARSMFNPKGTDGEKTFFRAKSIDVKDVVKAMDATRGLGLGIGCMVKVYTVGAGGELGYLMTLYPKYNVTMTPRGTSIKALRTPAVAYDERISLNDVQP